MPRRIKCKRCGACARTQKGVRISLEDAKRLPGKIPLEIWPKYAKIPVGENGYCVAFSMNGKKGSCRIYRYRPPICKQYPFVYFNGRVIIQSDCAAAKELLAKDKQRLSRSELEKIPFLAKALKQIEKSFPRAKEQNWFEITNA